MKKLPKKLPKILTIVFLSFIIIQAGAFLFLNLLSEPSRAIDFIPQVDIGGPSGKITGSSIGEYISAIYKYAIGIVGILAAVVLMFGGVIWLTAGGNTDRISSAKAWIGAALTGLILALCSYMILFTINPDLVNFKSINPEKVQTDYSGHPRYEAPPGTIEPVGCCYDPTISCLSMTEAECEEYKGRVGFAKNFKFILGKCTSRTGPCNTSCENTYPLCTGECPLGTSCTKTNNACKCDIW